MNRRRLFFWIGAMALTLAVSTAVAADVVSVSVAAESGRIFRWRPFLAPFHAVVLHFPIGFLTMAFILEIYRLRRPGAELQRVTVLVIWLSLLSGMASATFGILRAGSGGYEPKMLEMHRWFGLAVPIFTLATLGMQKLAYRDEARRGLTHGYRVSLVATLALLVVAGHYGGNLTHGARYLVEHAPEFVRELLDSPPAPPPTAPSGGSGIESGLYLGKVKPVFDAKCVRCHGPEKQKGGYRLDQPQLALKAGESDKPAIKPRDPTGSHLVQLILLPPEHDDVMPPSGKESLTSDEIMVILDWIRRGAEFPADSNTVTTAGSN